MPKYLVIPAADGNDLTRASLHDTASLAGLANGTSYLAWRLSAASSPFTPQAPTPEAPPFGPLAGILTAPHVVVIGASLEAAAMTGLSAMQAFAASVGFTGTLSSHATSGARLTTGSGGVITEGGDDQIAAARAARAATQGSNLYLYGIGGNDVTDNRPHPGGAPAIGADYNAQLAGLAATDRLAPIGISKRFYATAPTVTADPATEANGAKPYNDAIFTPAILTHAPDWVVDGRPAIDMYDFTARHPEILKADGVHYLDTSAATHGHAVLLRTAARAMGARPGSRAGRSILYTNRSGTLANWTLSAANPANYLQRATGQAICWAGARCLDGTLDPFISCIIPAQTVTFNSVAASNATVRLADNRFHNAEVHRYSVSIAAGVTNSWSWRGLWPGDVVTATVMGCSINAGTYGLVTIGGQTLTLQNAPEAGSNQAVFAPVTIGADGRLDLTFAVPAGAAGAGRFGSILLDFA